MPAKNLFEKLMRINLKSIAGFLKLNIQKVRENALIIVLIC